MPAPRAARGFTARQDSVTPDDEVLACALEHLDFFLVHVHSYPASSRGVISVSRDGRSTRRRWKAMTQDAQYTHAMATHPLLTGSGLAVLSLPLHLVVPAE